MKQRFCENIDCGVELIEELHKNRLYCSNECYYENKLRITNLKNYEARLAAHLNQNDDILKVVHHQFGSMRYISAALLESKRFDWSLVTKEIEIASCKARVIKNYAYTLFNNETVLIWKW